MKKWFIPGLEKFPTQRALLHLGLNKAVRYYRELVAPGIGGVWFVRQLSWAVAGIQLTKDINQPILASRIANAIEALACKLILKDNSNANVRGKRAFRRYPDAWLFKELSQPMNYVQVTYRQSAVTALLKLGITEGGMRFNSMSLSPIGEELANAFLNIIRNPLLNWIDGGDFPESGKKVNWLSQKYAGNTENQIVRDRLRADTIDNGNNPHRRRLLIDAFGKLVDVDMPAIKKELNYDQVSEIVTAESFDYMLTTARNLIYKCAEDLKNAQSKPIKDLAKENVNIIIELKKKALNFLKHSEVSKKIHIDAKSFADSIHSAETEDILQKLISRDGSILTCSDRKIWQGALFDRRQEIEEDRNVGSEEYSTKNKISQLFTLWKDCENAQ